MSDPNYILDEIEENHSDLESYIVDTQQKKTKDKTDQDDMHEEEQESKKRKLKKKNKKKKVNKKPVKKSHAKSPLDINQITISNISNDSSSKIEIKLIGNKRRIKNRFSYFFRKKRKIKILSLFSAGNSNNNGWSTEPSIGSIYMGPEEEYDFYDLNIVSNVDFNYDYKSTIK